MTQSARELTAAVLGQELAVALREVNSWILEPSKTDFDQQRLLSFGSRIKIALRDVWKEPTTDVFDIGFVFTLAVVLPVIPNPQSTALRKKSFGLTNLLRNLAQYKALKVLSTQFSISFYSPLMLPRSSCEQKHFARWVKL